MILGLCILLELFVPNLLYFWDNIRYMSLNNSVENRLFKEIQSNGMGKIYHLSDFFNLYNEEAIRKAFQRLEKTEKLIRLARGLYLYPKKDPVLGIVYPTMADIARDIARRDKLRILPTGDQALLQLGLSTQVPMKSVYLTDGGPRKIKVNKRTLIFKPTSPRMLDMKGPISSLVIQALKTIGRDQLTTSQEEKIREHLLQENPIFAEADALNAPAWVRELIMNIINRPERRHDRILDTK